MSLTMYQASVPTLERALVNLGEILEKGETFATEREIDKGVMLGSRLAVDMFPLTRQVQIVSDSAKGCVSRLAGVESPAWEDDEQSFAELYERIDRTIQYINSVPRDQIEGSEDKTVELKLPNQTMVFTGSVFLFTFALPNVFFHVTTAYNILRHCGVDIGKMDYLGKPPS